MDANTTPLKNVSKIALGAMGALFILGIIFYKERALFSDAAFRIFNVINYSRFDVPGNRYGAFIVQVLPYLARKLHLSITTILLFFGAGYNLFYFLATVLLVYPFKQYRLAVLMALYYFLFASESYIWVSETLQGTAWMFLFFAVTLFLGNKRVNIFLLLVPFSLLGILTIFSHFVIIIPLTFLWIYMIVEKENWPFSKNISIFLSCVLIIIIALKFVDTDSAYDTKQLHGITHFSLKDIIASFQTPVVQTFFYRCMANYWVGILVFIVSMIALIRNNERALAIWTFSSTLGYVIIMGLNYRDLDSGVLLFHIESEWSCIAIIIATPFVFAFLPKLKTSTAGWLLVGIFIVRLSYIVAFLPAFRLREQTKEQILSQMRKKGITKLALFNDARLISITKLYWALPNETIMASAMDHDKPQLTFFFINPDDKKTLDGLKDPKTFYDGWNMIPCVNLNSEYFNLDTTESYAVMTFEELMK